MLEDEIRVAEERLTMPSVRGSAEALDHLISDEFVEFGSSGQVYTKAEVIALISAAPTVTVNVTAFRVLSLSPDITLATYRTERSLRSSVWRREGQSWRIVFHQGTPIAE
jgi:hypothetical protein